jgi:hypothetical protein
MQISLDFSPDIIFFFRIEERSLLRGKVKEMFLINFWGDKELCKNTKEYFKDKCIGDSCFIFAQAGTLKYMIMPGEIK